MELPHKTRLGKPPIRCSLGPTMTPREIGVLVRAHRLALGWTLKMLAARSRTSFSTVYRIERGGGTQLSVLLLVLDALGLRIVVKQG